MEKISVTIIAFNEAKNIRRCLESVAWADEIVVVDSHSNDDTVAICREYTDRVVIRDWPGHIEQKNIAIDQATHSWIFSIDADEAVSPVLRDSILTHRRLGFEHYGYRVSRKVFYLGKWITHGGWYPDYKIRLFHRDHGCWGGMNPHDTVILDGSPATLTGDLLHYSYENIQAHIRQVNSFTTISANALFANGKRPTLTNILINPFYKFWKSYLLKRGFLHGRVGLYIALIGSFYVFLKYLKLWERYREAV